MMLRLSLFAATLSGSFAATTWRELSSAYSFDQYVAEFGKSYSKPAEYAARKERFQQQLQEILSHNADSTQTFKMGVNMFTDMYEEEMKQMKGLNRAMLFASASTNMMVEETRPLSDLPESVDWREKGVVTPVKNQGGCGSCWAFSTTEVLESAVAIKTGKLLTLAPQELVDCAPNPNDCGGSGGCEGSTQPLGFNYTSMAGMATEESYKYTARDGSCKMGSMTAVAGNKGYVQLPTNDYNALLNAVATVGPIAISVDASWGMYEEGVFSKKCGTTIDHAVVAVGYGTDPAYGDYWLVRNSWGSGWGEKGYIRLARSSSPSCGTDNRPQDGFGCKGGPSSIQVCGECGVLSGSSYPTGAKLV